MTEVNIETNENKNQNTDAIPNNSYESLGSILSKVENRELITYSRLLEACKTFNQCDRVFDEFCSNWILTAINIESDNNRFHSSDEPVNQSILDNLGMKSDIVRTSNDLSFNEKKVMSLMNKAQSIVNKKFTSKIKKKSNLSKMMGDLDHNIASPFVPPSMKLSGKEYVFLSVFIIGCMAGLGETRTFLGKFIL